jgi:hypothetical protein
VRRVRTRSTAPPAPAKSQGRTQDRLESGGARRVALALVRGGREAGRSRAAAFSRRLRRRLNAGRPRHRQ